MAGVRFEGVHKSYGAVHVVKGVDLEIGDGEFVALLGPSGCGKTTTLRMIAGLEEPTRGTITIGGETVSDPANGLFVPPERRRLGMVFQSYAVWPHMSVAANVAYPLRLAGKGRAERDKAVAEALEMVQLGSLGARMPHQLSGGQQQRVALARALVMGPRVLLLDEPLSNLDAHLREDLRREIARIRAQLGVTVVYVTHDQEEALALADRIVVLRDGLVYQAGPPEQVYTAPDDAFVGGFIGKANFLDVRVTEVDDGGVAMELGEGQALRLERSHLMVADGADAPGREGRLMVRPHAARVVDAGGLNAEVEQVTYLGDRLELLLSVGASRLRTHVDASPRPELGERVQVAIERAHLF